MISQVVEARVVLGGPPPKHCACAARDGGASLFAIDGHPVSALRPA
jgi:hypothetical protein